MRAKWYAWESYVDAHERVLHYQVGRLLTRSKIFWLAHVIYGERELLKDTMRICQICPCKPGAVDLTAFRHLYYEDFRFSRNA